MRTHTMLWPASSNSNEGLVRNLQSTGVIQSDAVAAAMGATDRAKYLAPLEFQGQQLSACSAYADTPAPIGHNQTISAPHMVCFVLR